MLNRLLLITYEGAPVCWRTTYGEVRDRVREYPPEDSDVIQIWCISHDDHVDGAREITAAFADNWATECIAGMWATVAPWWVCYRISLRTDLQKALRLERVRDGSLLDDEAMKLLAEYAEENDLQVWIERVDSSGAVGFVIENGMLKGAEKPEMVDA